MTETAEHGPDAAEKLGRRLKMEYVGMASGFFVIFCLFLLARPTDHETLSGWSAGWLPVSLLEPTAAGRALLAMLAFFELFLALKKKTRDHISASLLLLATALVVRLGVAGPGAAIALACLGLLLAAMEGSIEKRRGRVFFLPILFWIWAAAHPTFLVGLVVPLLYLLPAPERQAQRSRIAALWATSALASCLHPLGPAACLAAARALFGAGSSGESPPLSGLVIAAPALAVAVLFWRPMLPVHRSLLVLAAGVAFAPHSELVFVCLLPVSLAATLFRDSIHFDGIRPLFKRAEWYYFWAILAVALVCLSRSSDWLHGAAR